MITVFTLISIDKVHWMDSYGLVCLDMLWICWHLMVKSKIAFFTIIGENEKNSSMRGLMNNMTKFLKLIKKYKYVHLNNIVNKRCTLLFGLSCKIALTWVCICFLLCLQIRSPTYPLLYFLWWNSAALPCKCSCWSLKNKIRFNTAESRYTVRCR